MNSAIVCLLNSNINISIELELNKTRIELTSIMNLYLPLLSTRLILNNSNKSSILLNFIYGCHLTLGMNYQHITSLRIIVEH